MECLTSFVKLEHGNDCICMYLLKMDQVLTFENSWHCGIRAADCSLSDSSSFLFLVGCSEDYENICHVQF